MLPVLSAADVRQAELAWAQSHGGETWPLMEKAANSFVQRFLSELNDKHVLVLVGQGNNGGDGYLIAHLLRGCQINVELVAPFGLPPESIDAYRAYLVFTANQGVVKEVPDWENVDVIVDALFGSGLSRKLSTEISDLITKVNEASAAVFSVDIPTGLNAQTGEPMPEAVDAQATHSFIAFKPGMLTGNGPRYCGRTSLDSLDVTTKTDWQRCIEVILPKREGNTHKANYGKVLVIGGLEDMAGASIIAGHAALNAGAGRVLLHCNPDYFLAAITSAPELIVARDVTESMLSDSCVVAGPGLGRSQAAGSLVQQVLTHAEKGVLDADALRYLADNPQTVADFVLTPHEGEAAALLTWSANEVRTNRVEAALQLSHQYQTTVVLKGAGSIVASGSQLCFCHPGTAKMATPGMGDCLAGMIASLLAQGLSFKEAAINGVNWHASLAYKLSHIQRVVLATDVIEHLKFD